MLGLLAKWRGTKEAETLGRAEWRDYKTLIDRARGETRGIFLSWRPDLAQEWDELEARYHVSRLLDSHFPRPGGWSTMNVLEVPQRLRDAINGVLPKRS